MSAAMAKAILKVSFGNAVSKRNIKTSTILLLSSARPVYLASSDKPNVLKKLNLIAAAAININATGRNIGSNPP